MFYSPSTSGFYLPEIHGARKINVVDPLWERPDVTITLQPGESVTVGDSEITNTTLVQQQVSVPDMSVDPVMIEVDNPDCNIPADAVEITGDQHQALLEGQSQGKVITTDANGFPALQDRPNPTSAQILEAIKTERDRRKHAGVNVNGHWFHTDPDSRIQQIGLVMMGANIPANLQWKTMSGAFVTMTPALAGAIFQAVAAQDMTVFSVAEAHRANMEAPAEPWAYDYSTGWPPSMPQGSPS